MMKKPMDSHLTLPDETEQKITKKEIKITTD